MRRILWLGLMVAAAAAAADDGVIPLATFDHDLDGFGFSLGTEFPGARGEAQREPQREAPATATGRASLRLHGDFRAGGVYVSVGRALPYPVDLRELRFLARSTDVKALTVRLTDSTGQSHQHVETLQPDGEWHPVRVTTFAGGPGYQSWGGAKDRRWHGPAKSVDLILEKSGVSGQGTVWLAAIELLGERSYPVLDGPLPALGHVFLTTEARRFPLTTRGDHVAWRVTDYQGEVVGSGDWPVAAGQVQVTLPPFVGYYRLRLEAFAGAASQGVRETVYAVLPPVDPAALHDSPFGVCTHFAQGWDPDLFALVAKAGIAVFRDEHYWATLETKPGTYSFPARDERYMAAARAAGVQPLTILSFENKLYDGGDTPHTPAGYAGYAGYADAVLRHYGDALRWVEVWNEYNGSFCKGPAKDDRAHCYAELLKAAYARVKATRPDVTVLGGAAVLQPLPWFESLFKEGALDSMDAVVIHPYRGEPEGVENEIAALRQLIAQYNHGPDKPIWATETGVGDTSEGAEEAGLGTYEKGRAHVARYLVRQMTLLRAAGVEKAFWYLLRDYDAFKTMGLLRADNDKLGRYAVAPAYCAYAALIRQLADARFVRRESTAPETRIYTFAGAGGEQVRVCWATQPATVTLAAPAPLTRVDLMGREETLTPAGGEVVLTLTDSPVYIRGAVDAVNATGHFHLAAEQVADLGGEPGLDCALDQALPAARLAIGGHDYALQPGANRVILVGADTTVAGVRALPYRLLAGAGLAGAGVVRLTVRDPLGLVEVLPRGDGKSLAVHVRNASTRAAARLNRAVVSVGEQKQTIGLDATIEPNHEMVVTVPVPPLPAFRSMPASLELDVSGRQLLLWHGEPDWNPCLQRAVTIDGDLHEWADAPAIDLGAAHAVGQPTCSGQVWLGWDDAGLCLAARVNGQDPGRGDGVTLGVAPSFSGRWCEQDDLFAFQEFRAAFRDTGGTLSGAQGPVPGGDVRVNRDGEALVYELRVPWAVLRPLSPASGEIRLAVRVDGRPAHGLGWREWGGGLGEGHSPDGFRRCFLSAGTPAVGSTPPPSSSADERLLADSEADYGDVQGGGGWSYGFFAGDAALDGRPPQGPYTAHDWRPMTLVTTPWGKQWQGSAPFLSIGAAISHPGVIDGRPAWSVRRWQSPVAGRVHLQGSFRHDRQGDGVGGRILVDGVQVFEALLGGPAYPAEAPFDLRVPVTVGSVVDFAVTPGPAVNIDFDATPFNATIRGHS